MRRELVVFVLFLLMNVTLSVNCFFPFSITLASVARDVSRENEKKDNPFPKSEQIKNYSKITSIALISKNPMIFQFSVDSKTNICLKLKDNIYEYDIKDLSRCNKNTNESKENIKWLKLESKTQTYISNRLMEYEKMLINSNDSNQFLFSKKNEDSIESYIIDEEKKTFNYSEHYTKTQDEIKELTGQYYNTNLNSLIQIKSTSISEPIHLIFFERENETLFKNFILVWDKGDTISTFHWNILFWRTLQIIGLYLDILINKAVFSP